MFPEGVSEEEFFGDDANLPQVKELIPVFPRVTSEALDRLNGLDPPSEVEEAHNELVNAMEDLAAAFEEGGNALQETETFAEFDAVNDELDSTLLTPAEQRVEAACLEVVAVGAANNITVNATCEDEA